MSNTFTEGFDDMNHYLHGLTDELQMLCGWGAIPHRLATMSVLVMLAGAQEARESQVGYIALDYLKECIDSWNETITFRDQVVQPEVARRCFLLLFKIEGTGLNQRQRRTRVIRLLRAY